MPLPLLHVQKRFWEESSENFADRVNSVTGEIKGKEDFRSPYSV